MIWTQIKSQRHPGHNWSLHLPSGKTHAAITLVAAAGLAAGAQIMGEPRSTVLALSGGCLFGILVGPDLDVDNPTRSHYVVGRRWGLIAFGLWFLLWYPYARLLSHRSFWSHAPVISTGIRVCYMAAIAWIVLSILRKPWPPTPYWATMAIAGLVVSDVLHWAADSYITKLKKKQG